MFTKLTSKGLRRALALAVPAMLIATGGCPGPNTHPTPSLAFTFPVDGAALHQSDSLSNPPAGAIVILPTLTATNVSSGSTVTLTVDGNAATTGKTGANGAVTLAGNVTLQGNAQGESHALQATVVDSGGNGNASATAHVTVVLAGASCTVTGLTPADGAIFNESGAPVGGQATLKDEDPTKAGMQAKITASTTCPDGSSASLFGGPAVLATGTVKGGSVTFDQATLPDTPVTALKTAALRLQISVSVAVGSSSATGASVGYVVDSSTPTCALTSPADGGVLNSLNVQAAGTSTGLTAQIAAGIPAAISIVDATGAAYPTPNGPAQVKADGTFGFEITINPGANSLACQATTATGNQAQGSPVLVTATTGAVSLTITQPTANQVLNTLLDESASTPGLQYDVHLATTAGDGSSITVCSTVQPTSSAAACPFGTGAFTLNATPATVAGGSAVLSAVTFGEGAQIISAQVSGSGISPTPATPVAIEVHTTRPVVSALTFAPAYTDSDGGLWLNATELSPDGGAATVATVTLASDTFTGDAGSQLVTIVDLSKSSAVVGSGPVVSSGASPQAKVSITGLTDGTTKLEAHVSDIWGNPNYSATLTPNLTSTQADATLEVKTQGPTCNISGPSGPYWNVADNGGAASGSVNLPVTVATTNATAQVGGNTIPGAVTIKINGGGTATVPAAGSAVGPVPVAAGQGADTITASVSDPAGNPPASCTPVGGVAIDLATTPPTLTIAPSSSWLPAPDSINSSGVAVYATACSFQIPITTSAPTGANITSTINGLGAANATVGAGGAATLDETAPTGSDLVAVTVKDAAGNVTTQQVSVILASPTCLLLAFTNPSTNPAYFNASNGAVAAGVLTASVSLQSSTPSTSVTLTKTPSVGAAQPFTQSTDLFGNVVFAGVTFVDGETGTLGATMTVAGNTVTAGPVSYSVKLTAPQLSAPVPNASSVFIVSPSANPNVGQTLSSVLYVGSISAYDSVANPFANGSFQVTVQNLGPGTPLGTAALHLGFAGVSDPPTQTLPTDPATVTFGPVNLPPHAADATVTLTVTDAAGNQTVQTWTVQTDVIPPVAPVVSSATVSDQRKASVQLKWNAPADDTGGAVAGYDLRWTTATWPATISDAQFFATAGVVTDPNIGSVVGGAPGSAQTYTSTGFTPFNSWSLALRAVDAAGNRSEPVAATTLHDNTIAGNPAQNWNQATFVEPNGNYFGYQVTTGDFNGDGISDFAVSDPQFTSTPGSVWVIAGKAGLASVSDVTQAGASLALTMGASGDSFGCSMAAGDFTGAGQQGLAIGSEAWTNNQGRVDIYASGGASGLDAVPVLELQGGAGTSNSFGATVRSIGDLDSDGFPDLFVGAPFTGANDPPNGTAAQGAGYVFLSSSLRKVVVAGTTTVVPLSAADLVFEGSTTAQENFGYRFGVLNLGNGFVLLPASGGDKEYGYSITSALANEASQHGGTPVPIPTTAATFTASDNTPLTSNQGFVDAFGAEGLAGLSFTGAALPDVVISNTGPDLVYLYQTTASGIAAAPVATMNAFSSNFGWALTAADINGDGLMDLLVGSNSASGYGAYLFLNQGKAPWFSAQANAVIENGVTFFGYGVSTGHFLDTSTVDLVVADGFTTATLFY